MVRKIIEASFIISALLALALFVVNMFWTYGQGKKMNEKLDTIEKKLDSMDKKLDNIEALLREILQVLKSKQ